MKPFNKRQAGITESSRVHYQALVDGEFECRAAIVINALREDEYSDGAVDLAVFERPTAALVRWTPDPDQPRKNRKAALSWVEFEVTYHDPFLGGQTEPTRREGTWHFAKD